MNVSNERRTVRLEWPDGQLSRFHAIWLRDNCGCQDCRVAQSGERLLYTADIADDLTTTEAFADANGDLNVSWSDGHRSVFNRSWLRAHDYSRGVRQPHADTVSLWGEHDQLPEFEHTAIFHSSSVRLEYLDVLSAYGAAMVKNTPSSPNEVIRFGEALGVVRHVAFGTVHDVRNDPDGYNVAHTALELKPHSDLASYSWPPSFQLLHFLENEVSGGETVLVDGWNVLHTIKRDNPDGYRLLLEVPVAFKIFSQTKDTYACEPIVQQHSDGRIRTFRFSNQTAQPLLIDPERIEAFYRVYKQLGQRIADPRFRISLKAQSGDMLTLHNHRVLHGRKAFDPLSGRRHLQDLYMEWDDVMAHRRVLRGHLPLDACPTSTASAQRSGG